MVQPITSRLGLLHIPVRYCCLALIFCNTLQGNIFNDAWNGLKDAGHKIDSAFRSAGDELKDVADIVGNAIVDRFRDTKLTRAVDYGIRKAALETALATANGILEGAREITTGSLTASEEVAQASITASEKFLSDVVQAASPAILEGSATAAKGILEGVKQSSIATLQGGEWIVSNVLDQFDINRLRYQEDLRSLEKGILGNVLCEGKLLGNTFSLRFDLDPRDLTTIGASLKPFVKQLEAFFNTKTAAPLSQQMQKLDSEFSKVKNAEAVIAKPMPPEVTRATAAYAALQKIAKDIDAKEAALLATITETAKRLEYIAQQTTASLKDIIQKAGAAGGRDSVLARQELVRRAQAQKK